MTEFFRVLCTSPVGMTQLDVMEFVEQGVYFEDEIVYESVPDSNEITNSWTYIDIHYASDKRPIVLHRSAGDHALMQDEIDEIGVLIDGIEDREIKKKLSSTMDALEEVYAFEVDPGGLSDDAWELVDALESYIAKRGKGILYVPDEGFFDGEFEPLWLE